MRATGAELTNPQPIANTLTVMGMPVHRAPSPAGYAYIQSAWLGTDAMNQRLNFALGLGQQSLSGVNFATSTSSTELSRTLGGISPKLQQVLSQSPSKLQVSLILGSPEFMKY